MRKQPKEMMRLWRDRRSRRNTQNWGESRKRLFVYRPRIQQLFPNGITIVSTCSGLMGLLFALKDSWHWAVLAVMIAGVMDALDGSMARALGSTSHFGAELDSLSDVIAFGVCPVMILYLWGMQSAGNWGVMAVLLFVVCCLLRLARFNTMAVDEVEDSADPSVWQNFFQGVPATMGGALVLLPIVVDLAGIDTLLESRGLDLAGFVTMLPFALVLWTMILSMSMISSLPVFSPKKVRVTRRMAFYAMALGVPFVIATLVSRPWVLLLFMHAVALMSIPFSIWSFVRLRRRWKVVGDQEGRDVSLANIHQHRRDKKTGE